MPKSFVLLRPMSLFFAKFDVQLYVMACLGQRSGLGRTHALQKTFGVVAAGAFAAAGAGHAVAASANVEIDVAAAGLRQHWDRSGLPAHCRPYAEQQPCLVAIEAYRGEEVHREKEHVLDPSWNSC